MMTVFNLSLVFKGCLCSNGRWVETQLCLPIKYTKFLNTGLLVGWLLLCNPVFSHSFIFCRLEKKSIPNQDSIGQRNFLQ